MLIRLRSDFVGLEEGQLISAELNPDNKNVYIGKSDSGTDIYIPVAICEVVSGGDAEVVVSGATVSVGKSREPVFSTDTMPQPTMNEGISMSPEELSVLQSLEKKTTLKRTDKDGTTTATSFEVDNSLTLESKMKAQEERRLKKVRSLLKYTEDKPLLQEGQVWLTDITGGRLPDSGVNRIITTYNMTKWEQDSAGIWHEVNNLAYPWLSSAVADIPQIDPDYFWDADVLEAIVLADALDEKVLLVGLPGTGKTSACKQYGAWIDQPFMRFNGKEGIEQSSFLGQLWVPEPGKMEWQDGLLPQGLKLNYIVCIDEVFKIPPGIQMALQTLYEKDGFLMLDDKPGTLYDKMVHPGEHFKMMLTDNVKGTGDSTEMFAATQMQDSSTIDRFGITANVNYLPREQEITMMRKKYGSSYTTVIKKLVQFAGMVREAYASGTIALTLSPRGLAVAMEMIVNHNVPDRTALQYAFVSKIADDIELQEIRQFIRTVW